MTFGTYYNTTLLGRARSEVCLVDVFAHLACASSLLRSGVLLLSRAHCLNCEILTKIPLDSIDAELEYLDVAFSNGPTIRAKTLRASLDRVEIVTRLTLQVTIETSNKKSKFKSLLLIESRVTKSFVALAQVILGEAAGAAAALGHG